jgi:hypothetical protein
MGLTTSEVRHAALTFAGRSIRRAPAGISPKGCSAVNCPKWQSRAIWEQKFDLFMPIPERYLHANTDNRFGLYARE